MAWSPGWSELTVTPSGATWVARVLRKPVRPARAVVERIRCGDDCRAAIEVIASTRPQPLLPHGGHGFLAHRDRRQRVEGERVRVGLRIGEVVEATTGRSARVADEDVDPAERAPGRLGRSRPRRRGSTTSATRPTSPCAAAASRTRSASRPQIATCTPAAASERATARPSPADPAATAARFPAIPRSIGAPRRRRRARDASVAGQVRWIGPVPVAQVGHRAPRPGGR